VVWATLRRLHAAGHAATILEIERTSYVPRRTVASYVKGLVAAGFAIAHPPARRRGGVRYLLTDSAPHVAPRVQPSGGTVTQGSGRDRLWRSAKMLKLFEVRDLMIAASIEGAPVRLHEARTYLGFLHRAGYLAVQQPACTTPGQHRRTTYRFIRNTGPLAPMVTRSRAVWDPNLQAMTWQAAARPATKAAGGVAPPPALPGGMSPPGLQQGKQPNAEDF
jgi:hypothetical protein